MNLFFKRVMGVVSVLSVMCTGLFSLSGCTKGAYSRGEDTEYSILMISDIHLDNTRGYERRAFRTIDDLVEISRPDMIIVTGDVTGVDDRNDLAFTSFGEHMESYGIPWTFTFGNHDAQGTAWSKEDIADYLQSLPHCTFSRGDGSVYGYGNNYYVIKDKQGKTIQIVFTLDTSGPTEGTHPIETSQIDWYVDTVRSVSSEANGDETRVVPSIIFAHIPMREYADAYAAAETAGTIVYGGKGEKECPAGADDELFETIVSLGSTTAYYCGHEHLNNYVVYKDGIRLTYTETCDHKWYIPTRGGLVVRIKSDGRVTQQNIRRRRLSSRYLVDKEF